MSIFSLTCQYWLAGQSPRIFYNKDCICTIFGPIFTQNFWFHWTDNDSIEEMSMENSIIKAMLGQYLGNIAIISRTPFLKGGGWNFPMSKKGAGFSIWKHKGWAPLTLSWGGAGSAEVNKGGYWVKGEGPKKGGSLNPGWNHVPLPIHSHNTLTLSVTNTHRQISHRIIFGFEFYRLLSFGRSSEKGRSRGLDLLW